MRRVALCACRVKLLNGAAPNIFTPRFRLSRNLRDRESFRRAARSNQLLKSSSEHSAEQNALLRGCESFHALLTDGHTMAV
jgi:hypothetical protein